jgi:thiamine-phosphate pyrophosphorylase
MTHPIRGLMALADDSPCWKLDPVELARAACEGGASIIQLRAKRATDRVALQWAEAIRELTRKFGVDFFVNDRFDLALASDADGVHLGQGDFPPHRLPTHARSRLKVGRSTHSLEQAAAACTEPIDYIAFGPVFDTGSKRSTTEPRGVDRLAEVVRHAHPRPVIAIGGIDLDNAGQVAATGVAGIAVISAIADAADPRSAARALGQAVNSSPEP